MLFIWDFFSRHEIQILLLFFFLYVFSCIFCLLLWWGCISLELLVPLDGLLCLFLCIAFTFSRIWFSIQCWILNLKDDEAQASGTKNVKKGVIYKDTKWRNIEVQIQNLLVSRELLSSFWKRQKLHWFRNI